MAETLHKLQHIYAKWETRNPRQGNYGHPSQAPPDGCRSTETGKQAWTRKFGNIGPAPVRRQKYSRGKPVALSTAIVTSSSLGFFKSTPTVQPAVAQVRPLLGRCCTCMPSCREDLYQEDLRDASLQNLLRASTQIHCNGATKTFSFYQFLQDKHSYKYPDVTAAARRSERVRQAIETSIHSELDDTESDALCVAQVRAALRQHRRFVSNTLRQMKARVSDRLLRWSAWLLHHLLACVFSAVLVHSGQMTMIQKAAQRDLPLIFVPTRRSYFDHILLSFVLISHGMRAPHVALGNESRISMFSRIFQWLGAVFIQSHPNSPLAETAVYDATVCSYIEELLRRHQHIGLYVEGQRSTNGRAGPPTAGVLSGVVCAYYEGAMADAYIVPVSISYEKLPEGMFSDRQLGGVEAAPSLTSAIWCVWRLLRQRHGSVRLDFCQPFLLREFLHVASSFERADSGDVQWMRDEDVKDSEAEDDTAQCLCDAGDNGDSCDVVLSDEHVNTATVLAQHVVYDCVRAQAVMSSHLLAFLLLNKYRQGARLPNLMSSFDWLKKEVIAHGRDLGFTGNTDAVVEHARQLLGPALVKYCPATPQVDLSETNPAACLQPITSLPGVLDLAYYAQAAASVFVIESIVANVIHSMADPGQRSTDSDLDRSVPLSKEAILEQCKTLCGQLKYDYVFLPPCASLELRLVEALEQFLLCEVLQEEEANTYTDSRERAWAQRVSASLSLGVYDEDQEDPEWGAPDTLYKVNLSTPYTAEKFEFLRGVIAPTLETHYVTSCCLATLLDTPRTESEFVTNTLQVLIERVETSVATYEESASLDAVNNAVRSFEDKSVIQCHYDNDTDVKTVCLRGSYRDLATLEKFIASLERYRT